MPCALAGIGLPGACEPGTDAALRVNLGQSFKKQFTEPVALSRVITFSCGIKRGNLVLQEHVRRSAIMRPRAGRCRGNEQGQNCNGVKEKPSLNRRFQNLLSILAMVASLSPIANQKYKSESIAGDGHAPCLESSCRWRLHNCVRGLRIFSRPQSHYRPVEIGTGADRRDSTALNSESFN